MFVSSAIEDEITIVSMGAGEGKGFFKKIIEQHTPKIKIVYLTQWHLTLFNKKLRHIFYSFFLFGYLVRNVKRNDKLILYNSCKSFFMIMPVLAFKIFRKVKYILEIEELYSYKKGCEKLSYSERISINKAAACLIVNKNIQTFIPITTPVLVNAGYYSFEKKIIQKTEVSNTSNIQIVYSGRLDKQGGILIFLGAIPYINFKCYIVITGKGEYEEDVKNYTCSNPNVTYKYLGVLNDDEYHQMLDESQIAINPLLQTHDFANVSFPSKVTQYLAYGLKVISSNINSLIILKQLNEYIFTYDADDPKELASKINSQNVFIFDEKEAIIKKTNTYFENSKSELTNFIDHI